MSEKAILFDSTRCTACKGCQVACKCWNNLPSPLGLNANECTGSYQSPLDLNGDTRLIITFDEEAGGDKGVLWAFGRRSCNHCTDAPCAKVCPAGALVRNEETGLVEVNESLCIGCHYCSTACPFDVPRYHGDRGVINKCTGCADRVEQGMSPACVATCQPEALKFGERSEMLEIAYERAALYQEKGFDSSVYGDSEMGGLHVIHVLKHGISKYTLPENPHTSALTELTQLVKPVTGVVTGAAVLGFAAMVGLAAGYHRPDMAYNPETGDTLDTATGEVLQQGSPADEMSVGEHLREALAGFTGKGAHNE